jgi:DNA-binding CsgD family transcriptional regulator
MPAGAAGGAHAVPGYRQGYRIDPDTLGQLIDRIYAAALDGKLWPETIRQILNLTGLEPDAGGASSEWNPGYESGPPAIGPPGLPAEFPGLSSARRPVEPCPPTPEFYGLLKRYRSAKHGHGGERDMPLFDLLLGHVEQALQIALRMDRGKSVADASLQALDLHPAGVVLLDRQGRVLHANTVARALACDPGGICLERESLAVRGDAQQARLQELITCAIANALGVGITSGGTLSVPRAPGARPLSLTVAPVGGGSGLFEIGRPCVLVLIADPDRRQPSPKEYLRTTFRLTHTEASLAVLLATGMSLEQAAGELGLSHKAAQSRLTRIYGRTGTRRQAELVRLLLVSDGPVAGR